MRQTLWRGPFVVAVCLVYSFGSISMFFFSVFFVHAFAIDFLFGVFFSLAVVVVIVGVCIYLYFFSYYAIGKDMISFFLSLSKGQWKKCAKEKMKFARGVH